MDLREVISEASEPIYEYDFPYSAREPFNIHSTEAQYVSNLGNLEHIYDLRDPGYQYLSDLPVIYNSYAAEHLMDEDHHHRLEWIHVHYKYVLKAISDPEIIEATLRCRSDGHFSATQIVKLHDASTNGEYLVVAISLSNGSSGYHQITTIHPAKQSKFFYADGSLRPKYKPAK